MKEKMTVCLLNDSFPPTIDGVANVVLNYAKNLKRSGSKVFVVTPSYPEAEYNYDFDVLNYPSINTIDKIGYVTGFPFDIKFISQFIDKDIDVLHTHCPMTSNILARIIRKTIHKPIVFTYHTKYDIDIQRAIKGKLIQETAIKAIVDNISACDEVWAVSNGAAENLRSLGYKGDIVIMRNGIDMEKGISSDEEIKQIKDTYSLNDNVPTFLFVGRMMWYKGIRIILDGLKLYKESGHKFKMLFIGSGLELDEIKKYCSELNLNDCVIFGGPIHDRKILKAIFSACDLFLFPSTFDTNGLVVGEAASSGLASVLVKGSCAAEDTIDNYNALLIEENAQSLFNVLCNTNIDDYKRIGLNAMNSIYRSWKEATDEAYQRYQNLVSNYKYSDSDNITDNLFDVISKASIIFNNSQKDIDELKDLIESEVNTIKSFNNKVMDDIHNDIDSFKEHTKNDIKNMIDEIRNR